MSHFSQSVIQIDRGKQQVPMHPSQFSFLWHAPSTSSNVSGPPKLSNKTPTLGKAAEPGAKGDGVDFVVGVVTLMLLLSPPRVVKSSKGMETAGVVMEEEEEEEEACLPVVGRTKADDKVVTVQSVWSSLATCKSFMIQ